MSAEGCGVCVCAEVERSFGPIRRHGEEATSTLTAYGLPSRWRLRATNMNIGMAFCGLIGLVHAIGSGMRGDYSLTLRASVPITNDLAVVLYECWGTKGCMTSTRQLTYRVQGCKSKVHSTKACLC